MARAQPNKQPTTPESGREPPYRLLTEALPAITYIVDLLPTPHTTYISPQVESILGFTPAEWLADPDFWTRQLHPDDRERILKAIRRHNKTGDSFFLEYRCLTQSGDPVWLRSSATYQRDEAGRLTAVHGVMLDITERVNSEQALRESEQRFKQLTGLFRNMADVMPDMVWAKDMDRRFIFVNRALCDNLLIARNLEEPIGKTDLFFSRREQESHPDDPDWHTLGQICQNSDAVVMESRETRRFEEFGNVQGRYLHLDVIKTPLWNEQGEMIGTVVTGRDITVLF